MNAIILVAAMVGQFDMLGESNRFATVDFDMLGKSAAAATASHSKSVDRFDMILDGLEKKVGKPPAAAKPIQPSVQLPARVRTGYPVRGGWWTGCGGWRHLMQGEHAGKFDAAWLQSLSNSEIQSLHSDDHEGRVKWQYVSRPAIARAPAYQPQNNCPGGVCPVDDSVYFRKNGRLRSPLGVRIRGG